MRDLIDREALLTKMREAVASAAEGEKNNTDDPEWATIHECYSDMIRMVEETPCIIQMVTIGEAHEQEQPEETEVTEQPITRKWQRGVNSGVAHGPWEAWWDLEEDSDGFKSIEWFAKHRETGEQRLIQHSRTGFQMSEARFRWLADNNFPLPPGKGPWTSAAIDAAMKDGA